MSYARKHMLSGQTLEMLADMRLQFAAMLADIGFVAVPKGATGRGQAGKSASARHWVDERKAAWNAHSSKPAVVICRLMFVAPDCMGPSLCPCMTCWGAFAKEGVSCMPGVI